MTAMDMGWQLQLGGGHYSNGVAYMMGEAFSNFQFPVFENIRKCVIHAC